MQEGRANAKPIATTDRLGPPAAATRSRGRMRQPRLANMVASSLRNEILSGRLNEGDMLPRQEDLIAEFEVSPPAIREALRILETEGLVAVRRGNVGGAVVHLPTEDGVAYMAALVLQRRGLALEDVGAALAALEPLCASMCAQREDREETVLPVLRQHLQQQRRLMDDVTAFNAASRLFHRALVQGCGNEPMVLMVGALESIWSAHEARIYEVGPEPDTAEAAKAIRAHERLVEMIESGNMDSVANLARRHLKAAQTFTMQAAEEALVSADHIREWRPH